jgi:hypothetical protein
MDKMMEYMPILFAALLVLVIWFIIRKILSSLSDRMNNSELYKEDMLNVLEEIRDELKELNKNNTVK